MFGSSIKLERKLCKLIWELLSSRMKEKDKSCIKEEEASKRNTLKRKKN